jgi:hypothetical protein
MRSTKEVSSTDNNPIAVESIEHYIHLIRGHKVMLDRDLAMLYQVKAIALRQQVKRNRARFPADFMFQLTTGETRNLVSQNVIPSKQSLGGYLPYAFTQEGVAMLSSVLRSKQAVQVNIAIMRAFVRLRSILAAHKELARKIDALEKKTTSNFEEVYRLISKYLKPASLPRPKIGFRTSKK